MHGLPFWAWQQLDLAYIFITLMTYYVACHYGRNKAIAATMAILFPVLSLIIYLIIGRDEGKQLDMKTYMERVHKEREDLKDLQNQLEIKSNNKDA